MDKESDDLKILKSVSKNKYKLILATLSIFSYLVTFLLALKDYVKYRKSDLSFLFLHLEEIIVEFISSEYFLFTWAYYEIFFVILRIICLVLLKKMKYAGKQESYMSPIIVCLNIIPACIIICLGIKSLLANLVKIV